MTGSKLIQFFIEIGKLKKMPRSGWVLRGVKNPETIAEHTFRMAIMSWIFGKKKNLNQEKLIKMALIHDLCEVYAGDATPYDPVISGKNKKDVKELVKNWPGYTQKQREKLSQEKTDKEKAALKRITFDLSSDAKKEIFSLWDDYDNGRTKEGRFIRELDRVENLLQAMEYWEKDKKFPISAFWTQIKEIVDDPDLLEFINTLDHYFIK